ncbi:MAG: M48 family metallopeptidase [Gammaproteobacteria bacterium]
MAIHVRHVDDIEVVVPFATSPASVERFVASQRDWIRRAREALAEQGPPPDLRLPNKISLPLTGETFVVVYGRHVPKKGWREAGSTVALGAQQNERGRGCRALRAWLQHKGKQELVPRLAERAQVMGMHYKRVQVRGQKTRWGSYSSSGTVSLNYCLLFTPPDLTDYLFVHELCHSRHMNHSKAFWKLVSEHAPNYRRQERRLNNVQGIVPDWLRLDD